MSDIDVEQTLIDLLHKEIFVELLAESGTVLPEEELVALMKLSENNPWNAILIHAIQKAAVEGNGFHQDQTTGS